MGRPSVQFINALQCTTPRCFESFNKHHQLRSHVALVHSTPGTKNFPCEHEGCNQSFATNQKLKAHVKSHQGNLIKLSTVWDISNCPSSRSLFVHRCNMPHNGGQRCTTFQNSITTILLHLVSSPSAYSRRAPTHLPPFPMQWTYL